MNLIAILNRDGGTFKTTDMDAYSQRVADVFKAEGHEIECRVVAATMWSMPWKRWRRRRVSMV